MASPRDDLSKDTVSEAIRLVRNGQPAQAEELCRKALVYFPDDPEVLHLLGIIASQTNRPAEALRLFDRALAGQPDEPVYHNSRGSLLYQIGRYSEAEIAFRTAIRLAEMHPELYNNLGNTLRGLGELAAAETCFGIALSLRPDFADVLNNLGATQRDQGKLEEAVDSFRLSIHLRGDSLDAWYNLGDTLYEQMHLEEAERCFRLVVEGAPHFLPGYVGLAHVLQSQSRLEEAMDVITAGLERAPGHPALTFVARLVYSSAIPGWHLPMINDHERNEAYERALRRAVTADSVVLEIGTGSSIVAMMAARAGARHVYTCEVNRPLARVAGETIALNGLEKQITVVPKLSTQLVVGSDLPEKADVFVSELINIGLLSPNMLAVLRHARANLIKPGAKIIPARATVHGALIRCDELARLNPVRSVHGFNLSRFDIFRSPGYAQIDLAADEHQMLSDSFAALDFDFCHNMPDRKHRDLAVTATVDGVCHGIVFWFDLWMDDAVLYSSASRSRTNHWKQAVHFFDDPVIVRSGEVLTVRAAYDNTRIFFGVFRPPE